MRRNYEKKPPAPARANAAINGSAPRGYAAPIAVSTPALRLGAFFLDAGERALSAIHHLIADQGSAAIQTSCDTATDADLFITRVALPPRLRRISSPFSFLILIRADSRRVFTPKKF